MLLLRFSSFSCLSGCYGKRTSFLVLITEIISVIVRETTCVGFDKKRQTLSLCGEKEPSLSPASGRYG